MRRHPHRPELDFLFIHTEIDGPFFNIRLAPIGIIELCSWLKMHGFRCRYLDTRSPRFSLSSFQDYLAAHRPRFIGFDLFTDTLFTVARLVRIARQESPGSRIVLGGAHASAVGGAILRDVEADLVVRGEGEIPCLRLLTAQRLADVPGIVYRRGRALRENAPPPPFDLDSKPSPDSELTEPCFRMDYAPTISTGRGCPYSCTFCAAPGISRKIRWRSPAKIQADVAAMLKQCSTPFLTITDDTFTLDPARVRSICSHLKEIGGGKDFYWYAEGRVDRLAPNLDLLPLMKDAGLLEIQFGIESGDEQTLEAYRKEIRLSDALKVARACSREGILLHVGFIFGGPGESSETLRKTREFLEQLIRETSGLLQFAFPFLNPFPGTEIFEHPERFEIELLDPLLFTSLSFDNCVTRTETLSRADIVRQRWEVVNPSLLLLMDTIEHLDDGVKASLQQLTERIGVFHLTQQILRLPPEARRSSGAFSFSSINESWLANNDHFVPFSEDIASSAVIIRFPFFTLSGDDTYLVAGHTLSAMESAVFHYASGKLTGAEIAIILNIAEEELVLALKTLSEKKVVFFRTF